eukprot:jgi/Chlat1/5990/Chrsp4S06304
MAATTMARVAVPVSTPVARSSFLGASAPSAAPKAAAPARLASFTVRAAAKETWLPGAPTPSYLDGLPASYGFDPLGLAKDPKALNWYTQSELVHCRFAMLGVAGIIIPDFLTSIGILDVPAWYDAGKATYFAPAAALTWVELLLFSWAEHRRGQDIVKPGSVNDDPIFDYALPKGELGYPGGIFDPLGYSKGSNMQELKVKEIKNGRLAMVAFLGFWVQSLVTHARPIDNLWAHLADPWHNNLITNIFGQ